MDYQEDFAGPLGLKGRRHTENFVQDLDLGDTQPTRRVEKEPTPEIKPEKQPRFNWRAFFILLFAITFSLIVGALIPGIFDEILAAIVISAMNGFIAAHR